MRLIDAEIAYDKIAEQETSYYMDMEGVQAGLDETPTVDAVAVRHGHWKVSNDNYFNKCSECGALYDIALTENIFTNYCPRCGAKMDGERREE